MSNRQTAVDTCLEDGEIVFRRSDGDTLGKFPAGGDGGGGGAFIVSTVPPTHSDGKNGDMYIDSNTDTIYGPKAPPTDGAPVHAMNPTYPWTTGAVGAPMSTGNKFKVVAGKITALRFYRIAAEPITPRTARLYSDTGTLLATSQPSVETAIDGWITVQLPAPISVTQDQQVVVAMDSVSHYVYNYIEPSPTPSITHIFGYSDTTINIFPVTMTPYEERVDLILLPTTAEWPEALGHEFPSWLIAKSTPTENQFIVAADTVHPTSKLAFRNKRTATAGTDLSSMQVNDQGTYLNVNADVGTDGNIALQAVNTGTSVIITPKTGQNAAALDIKNGFLKMSEKTADAPAPAADGASLYLKDNGSGKTQLCVRFGTGAAIVLATQV